MASRFSWDVFAGRIRRRIFTGLLLLAVAVGYGTWAGRRLAERGAERSAFDQPLVGVAGRVVRRLDRIPDVRERTFAEAELAAIARDQQDLLFGLTVLLLRLVATGTVAGLGLVLLTAGSTEWEIRSEPAARRHDDPR